MNKMPLSFFRRILFSLCAACMLLGFGAIAQVVGTTDSTPDKFEFSAATDVSPGELIESASIVVRGINTTARISIGNGEYSINDGAWTSQDGSVELANVVTLRTSAAATYGTTTRATLTIGDVSSSFSVSTRNFAPVSEATQVFSNPQTAEITSEGIVRFRLPPPQPLVLLDTATEGAILRIDERQAVVIIVNGTALTYQPESDSTRFQVKTIDGRKALEVILGAAGITAPLAGSSIPLFAGTNQPALLQSREPNTRIIAGRDSGRRPIAAVGAGTASLVQSFSAATPSSGNIVYAGEAVRYDSTGSPAQLRIGSLVQDQSQAGDFITAIPRASARLRVPRINGVLARFGTDLKHVIGRVMARRLGASLLDISQDSSTGVITLATAAGNTYRFLPIGTLALDLNTVTGRVTRPTTRAVAVDTTAANLTAIVGESLQFAVAPAASYSDLETAIKQIDNAATFEILADGVVRATITGAVYAALPSAQLIPGGSNCPKLDTIDGNVAVCDSSGNRQVLYAAFRDTDFLVTTFTSALTPSTVTASNLNDGRYAANVDAASYTLVPDVTLSLPPASQAGQIWWQEGANRYFLRYSDGSAQGFAVQ